MLPLFLTMTPGAAQEHSIPTETQNTGWYAGIDAGATFGYGGRLQAGYMATRNLSIAVYSEFTALNGKQMDGITEVRHNDNFIWENGIRIGWSFGRQGKK